MEEKEMQNLKKDLENMKQKTKDLYKRISARDNIIKKYKTKFKDTTIENEFQKIKTNEKNGISQDDSDIINKLKEEHAKQIEILNNKIEQYEKDIESSKNKIEQYENEIEPLKNKNKEYEKEIESSKDKIEQYENEIESLKSKNKEYEKEIESSKDKIEQYENDIESLKNKNKEYEKEINDKQELLEKEKNDKENKDKLILEKEKEIKNISEELKKVQKDNNNRAVENEEKVKSELENQKNKIELYEKENLKKEEEISKLKKSLEESTDKINKKDEILKSYEAEMKKQKSNIEMLQREKDTFESKIKEMNDKMINEEVHEEQFNPNKIREEVNKNVKAHYEKDIENKINEINKVLNKKLEEKINELEQHYLKKFNQKEEQMNFVYNQNNQKINELNGYLLNIKGGQDNNIQNINKCETVHNGIKCQKCLQEPIIGYRYKCSVCLDYNLCQICEEKNSISGDHQHDFIKIRKELKSNDLPIANINNKINEKENFNKIERKKKKKNIENSEYSYECINILQLSLYIYEGTEEGKIEIILKNNGKQTWPEGRTKLFFERESQINGNDIILRPQKPGEECKYDIILSGLKIFPPNQYKSYLGFYIGDDDFGEELVLTIIIKEKKTAKKEMEENMDKINEFRNLFELSAEDFSDEKIFEALKQNNFDYEETFSQLYTN